MNVIYPAGGYDVMDLEHQKITTSKSAIPLFFQGALKCNNITRRSPSYSRQKVVWNCTLPPCNVAPRVSSRVSPRSGVILLVFTAWLLHACLVHKIACIVHYFKHKNFFFLRWSTIFPHTVSEWLSAAFTRHIAAPARLRARNAEFVFCFRLFVVVYHAIETNKQTAE